MGDLRVNRAAVILIAVCAAFAVSGCSTLLSEDPTPVPGAAATLTRSLRTPIPTPIQSPVASPGAAVSPSRVAIAVSPGPSPLPTDQTVSEDEIAQLQQRLEQILSSPDLSGIGALLLDHVSFSTSQGGSIMDSGQAATWLRDHAGSGITVSQVDRSTQTLMLEVVTEGWPSKDPIQQGQVNFSLRRYDASGRPDDNGDWKIDVIEAD